MPSDRFEIDIRARDNVSSVAKRIQNQLEKLRVAASAQRLGKLQAAFQAGVPAEILPKILGRNVRESLTALESLRRKYTSDVTSLSTSLAKAFKEGDPNKIKAVSDELRQQASILNYVNRAYSNYIRQVARTKLEDPHIARLKRLNDTFNQTRKTLRRVATDFVWASLSMLGVSWSLQAVIDSTYEPIMRNVEALSNYSQAAFDVATWLAIAGRVGQEWAKDLTSEDISKEVQKMVDVGLRMKATWGSLRTLIMRFFADVFMNEDVKASMDETFGKLKSFFENPENIRIVSDLIVGMMEGISSGLDSVKSLSNYFTSIFGDEAIRNVGRMVGWLVVMMVVLRPLLAILQAIFSIVQAIFKFAEMAFGAIKWIVTTIAMYKSQISSTLQSIPERFFGAVSRIPALTPMAPIYYGAIELGKRLGVFPNTINNNVYVNVGSISSDIDLDNMIYKINRGISYQVVR